MIYFIGNVGLFEDMVYHYSSVENLKTWLSDKDTIEFDTETTGLDPHTNDIICYQIGNEYDQYVIDNRLYPITIFKKELTDKLLIIQNAKFDLKFLYKYNIIPKKVYDTMLVESILLNGLGASIDLKTIVKKYCNYDLDKSVRGKIHSVGLNNQVIKYAAEDVTYLSIVKRKQEELLVKQECVITAKLENNYVRSLAYMEWVGVGFNEKAWIENHSKNVIIRDELKSKMDSYILDNNITKFINNQLSFFSDKLLTTINYDSSLQVIELFKILGLKTLFKIKGELKSTVEYDYIKIHKGHPFVDIYLQYKEMSKLIGTYGLNFLEFVNPLTKRIHTDFWQIQNTYRISSNNPNIQNIPKAPEIRSYFTADDGNILCISDYSSEEVRVLADRSNESNLLDFFNKPNRFKGDSHCYVASLLFDELKDTDVTEIKSKHIDKRHVSKFAIFTIAYGGVGDTIAKNAEVSKEVGEFVYKEVLRKFPGLSEYFNECKKKALAKGYVLINEILGNKWYYKDYNELLRLKEEMNNYEFGESPKEIQSKYMQLKGTLERISLNSPIQGTASAILKLATIHIFEWILKNNNFNKIKIVIPCHDELVIECPEEDGKHNMKIIKDIMENAASFFIRKVSIPVEQKLSKVWEK